MIQICGWHRQYFHDVGVYASSVEPNNWKPINLLVLQYIKTRQVSIGLCIDCHETLKKELEFQRRREESGNA